MFSGLFRYLDALLTGRLDAYNDLVRPRADTVRALREREGVVQELATGIVLDPEGTVEKLERGIAVLERQSAEAARLGADLETLERYRVEIDRRRSDLVAVNRAIARVQRVKSERAREPHSYLVLRGRNQRGVPIFEGTWKQPSRVKAYLFLVAGTVFLVMGLWPPTSPFVRSSFLNPTSSVLFGTLQLAIGAIWVGIGLRRVREKKEYDRLSSIDELCQRFELQELSLLQEARQRGITPKRIVNGREYFDFRDFGEATVLLRAAKPPQDAAQELLRPAANTEADRETLLRVGPPDGR